MTYKHHFSVPAECYIPPKIVFSFYTENNPSNRIYHTPADVVFNQFVSIVESRIANAFKNSVLDFCLLKSPIVVYNICKSSFAPLFKLYGCISTVDKRVYRITARKTHTIGINRQRHTFPANWKCE